MAKVAQGKGLNQDSNPGLSFQSLCCAASTEKLVPEKKKAAQRNPLNIHNSEREKRESYLRLDIFKHKTDL